MFELIQRDGHSKETIHRAEDLEDIAEFVRAKEGLDPDFQDAEDFVGGFDDG